MNGIQIKILNHEKDINYGSIYENAAAQELKAHGFDPELLDEMEPDVKAELLEDAGFDPWDYGY